MVAQNVNFASNFPKMENLNPKFGIFWRQYSEKKKTFWEAKIVEAFKPF